MVTFDPAYEDPAEIRAQYLDVGRALPRAYARREDIRAAVKDHLLAGTATCAAGSGCIAGWCRRRRSRELVRVAEELDPGDDAGVHTAVPKPLRDELATRDFGPCGPSAASRPHASSADRACPADARRRSSTRSTASSGRGGPAVRRDRPHPALPGLRAGRARGPDEGLDGQEGPRRVRRLQDRRADRALVGGHAHAGRARPAAARREVAVPKAFTLAFGAGVVDRMATTSRSPRSSCGASGPRPARSQASQSRDWHEEEPETA